MCNYVNVDYNSMTNETFVTLFEYQTSIARALKSLCECFSICWLAYMAFRNIAFINLLFCQPCKHPRADAVKTPEDSGVFQQFLEFSKISTNFSIKQ